MTQSLGPRIKVVDLGAGMSAALIVHLLSEFGADIQRVSPEGGDPFAQLYPADAFWRRCERELDVDGLDAAFLDADVCLLGGESYPGLVHRYDAEDLAKRYPHLVLLDLESYATANLAGRPAVDVLAQARMGAVYEQYADRRHLYSSPLPTYGAAMMGLIGLQSALFERYRSGKGQIVRSSLQEGSALWMEGCWSVAEHADQRFAGGTPRGARSQAYQCRDGSYLVSTFGVPGAVAATYRALELETDVDPADRGMPDLARGLTDYFGYRAPLVDGFAKFDRDEILKRLWAAKIPSNPCLKAGEAWTEEQVRINGTIRWGDDVSGVGSPLRWSTTETASTPLPHRGRNDDRLPLAGVRVVDIGAWVAGPFTSKLLGELGADVIKVEPSEGEAMRGMYRVFASVSRGKRGIAIDLKKPEGVDLLKQICADADVVLHNMRVGVDKRLGVDPEALREINPDLIYLHSSAFGARGPKALESGFDPVTQPFCGHSWRGGGVGNEPVVYHIPLMDYGTGAVGAIGVLQALLHRAAGGGGVNLETSLLDTGLFFMSELVHRKDVGFVGAPQLNASQTGFHAAERLYRASDDWLAVAARGDAMAQDFARVLGLDLPGREHWGAEEEALIEQAIAKWTRSDLLDQLNAGGVWCEPCVDGYDNIRDPAAEAVGLVVSGNDPHYGEVRAIGPLVRFSRSRTLAYLMPFPDVGEDTRSVLVELNLNDHEIDLLYDEAAVV